MKRILSLFIFGSVLISAKAAELSSALIEVNPFWAIETQALSKTYGHNCDYDAIAMIQLHLRLVHTELASRDVSHLSPDLQRRRAQSLKHLRYYANRGIFPENLTHRGRRPVFIDHYGTHCAVGYLIAASGAPELSRRISANMNTHYLKDMNDSQLSDWVAQSGFTLDELAWIQPGYPLPVNWNNLKGGTSGPVEAIASDGMGGIYATGIFDSAGNVATNNAAQWYSGFSGYDWQGLHGNGANAAVYDIMVHKNEVYLAGAFSSVNGTLTASGVARWNGTSWQGLGQFFNGGLSSYVNDLTIYRDTLYAAGNFRSEIGAAKTFTNLAKWDGQQWLPAFDDAKLSLVISGEVNALHVYNNKLVVAGEFQLGDSAQTSNIFMIDGKDPQFFAQDISFAVNDLETYGGSLYAATPYDTSNGGGKGGILQYHNQQWVSRVKFSNWTYSEIRALEATDYGLAVGGDFFWDPGLGSITTNSALLLDSSANSASLLYSLGVLDSTVTCLHYENDILYLGGYFTAGLSSFVGGSLPLGHITSLDLANLGQEESLRAAGLELYPNPTEAYINLELPPGSSLQELQLFDMAGRKQPSVFTETETGIIRIETSELQPGNYLLQIETDSRAISEPLTISRN